MESKSRIPKRNPKKNPQIEFMTENLASKVENVKIWDLELNHIHLSDHYPISAVIDLEEK